MGIIEGPFSQVTFCGASVINFVSSVGWNNESSSLTVNLVEDPDLNQRFTQPICGTPAKFQFGEFTFEGLIQRWVEKNGFDGKPTFEVTLTDPRELLSGTQVILSAYRGDVGPFANLLNVFGYWEYIMGFGGALVNESGMIWNAVYQMFKIGNIGINQTPTLSIADMDPVGIMPAIHLLTSGANPTFGSPIKFLGYEYKVDLTGLPVPPAYYRMGGVSNNILDMVSEICQDGGHDFICYLENQTIKFKCVSRTNQPDPGQIGNFISSRQDVASNSLGYELRNDITNAFILGGDVIQLIQEYNPNGDDTIWPFWGFDIDGSIIMGVGQPEVSHSFHLNASSIADVVGSLTYPCSIPELRCALMDFDSWAFYVLKWEPDKGKTIGLTCAIDSTSPLSEVFPDTLFVRDIIAEDDIAAQLFGSMNESEYWTQRAQRVYEFVRNYASEYFGRKFLIRLPFFVYWKIEPETTHYISSDEPTDAGYFTEGNMPLGLWFENENTFLTGDGRFQCFVRFTSPVKPDLQAVSPDSIVVQGYDVYMRAQVDSDVGIVYPGGSLFPYCVVTLDSPLYMMADDPLGSIEDIAALLDYQSSEVLRDCTAGLRHDSFPLKIHPAPYRPDAIALPMKSNRDSYGPWFTTGGVDGKVNFERDESLVPWNYGGYDMMNLAAAAKLQNAATKMQSTETGSVEMAGSPDHSLGDELVADGPQITGIDVSTGTNGVTTTYRMQTYTPRFGQFTKDNADRLRRLGMMNMEMRRAIRNLYHRRLEYNYIVTSAQLGFMANTSRAVMQQTPHQVLLGGMYKDSHFGYRTLVSTQTAPEAVANVRGDRSDYWVAQGCMTMEGLLRPFSTNRTRAANDVRNDMPHYETANYATMPITRSELNPFATGVDIDYVAWGDTYPGALHTKKKAPDWENARLLGLRGPMVLVGWGYTYTGKPVPNLNERDSNGNPLPEHQWASSFLSNHRGHSEKWRAGPIGLYWDNWRKLWTIPTCLFGTLDADLVLNGTVTMTILVGTTTLPDKISVYNWLGTTILRGKRCCAMYYQLENKWYVVAVQC